MIAPKLPHPFRKLRPMCCAAAGTGASYLCPGSISSFVSGVLSVADVCVAVSVAAVSDSAGPGMSVGTVPGDSLSVVTTRQSSLGRRRTRPLSLSRPAVPAASRRIRPALSRELLSTVHRRTEGRPGPLPPARDMTIRRDMRRTSAERAAVHRGDRGDGPELQFIGQTNRGATIHR